MHSQAKYATTNFFTNPPTMSQRIGVMVKTRSGKTVNVPDIDTSTYLVSDLKQSLFSLLGLAVEHQRLIFAGKQLEDTRLLVDYGVTNGSTLHLEIRLGCCDANCSCNWSQDPKAERTLHTIIRSIDQFKSSLLF